MFLPILKFELRYCFKNAAFYVYAGVFFTFALLTMGGAAGIFGEGSAGAGIANSPGQIFTLCLFFNKLLLFLAPAIVGAAINRDRGSNFHGILFTYPFEKSDYLFGRFAGGMAPVLLIALITVCGLILGARLPGVEVSKIAVFEGGIWAHAFVLYLLPNLLLAGVLAFAVVVPGRNIYAGFIAMLIFFLLREALVRLTGGVHGGAAGLLIDPLGETAFEYVTQNRTRAELDALPVPVGPPILFNRLIWLAVSVAGFVIVYRRFSFQAEMFTKIPKIGKPLARPPGQSDHKKAAQNRVAVQQTPLSRVKPDFSFSQQCRAVWHLSKSDFQYILGSGVFLSILSAGALFIAVLLLHTNPVTDTKILPLTWMVLGVPVLLFSLLIQGLTFLYAGILTQRAKNARMNGLLDATPAPDGVFFTARLLTLIKMQVTLLALVMLAGMAVQVYSGHYRFEPGHYLFDLYLIHLPGFVAWAFVALFVQTLFTNPYLGLFALILGALGIENLPALGISSAVFRFNQSPAPDFFLKYSDLCGHAHGLGAHFLYKGYWLLPGVVLGCASLLFWQRGVERPFAERLRQAKTRLRGKLGLSIAVVFAFFICFGFVLRRQENKPVNKQWTGSAEKNYLGRFRREFGTYKNTVQPRIIGLSFTLNIYPENRRFQLEGHYTLANKTSRPIDTLLIKSGYDEVTTLHLPPNTTILAADTVLKFMVCKLKEAIPPGGRFPLSFTIRNKPNTILARNSNVLSNGTHLKNDIFPRLGYFAGNDHGAIAGSLNHYQSADSDLIELDAVVGTVAGQTAIAPGMLIKEWQKNGRHYFHYRTERNIKFVFSVLSGRYALLQEYYKGVDLRIYHHPQHGWNLKSMMAGLKAALDYNTAFFSPYQHKQAQIIEFPRSEGAYATTAANCIPVSEIRFVNDTANTAGGATDIAFYVAAHELSHQWWGNQLIPADAPGAVMLTESLAEYVTAKIYEKQFGKSSALQFLDIQMKRYRAGRAAENREEMPLARVRPDQSYIAYGKGAIAFWLLSERLGAEKLNAALRSFLEKNKRQGPPYPTAAGLITELRAAAPDSLQNWIGELLESTDIRTLQLN